MTTKTPTQREVLKALQESLKSRTQQRLAAMGEAVESCRVDGRLDRSKFEAALPPIRGESVKIVAPELGRDGLILPGTKTTNEIAEGLGRLGNTIDKAVRTFGERAVAEVATAETADVVASIITRVRATHGDIAADTFTTRHNDSLLEQVANRVDTPIADLEAIIKRRTI